MSTLAIVGATDALGGGCAPLFVRDGRIVAPAEVQGAAGATVDATGLLVAPGFIDLQCNGAYGIDLAREPERLWELAAQLPRHGVTAFLPTLVSCPASVVDRARTVLADRPPSFSGAEPLGLHLEGPLLNAGWRGSHPARHIRPVGDTDVDHWRPEAGVRMVTLAPELRGALPLVIELTSRQVVVAAGHSGATAQEAVDGFRAGVTHVTHLFNAMAPFSHREPGLAGAALADHQVTASVIADGVHVHPAALAAASAALGPRRLALVTDSVAPAGMRGATGTGTPANGTLAATGTLGEVPLTVDQGVVRDPAGRLAGSLLTLDQAVRKLVQLTGCAPADALTSAAVTPARILGLEGKGRSSPGADADLVLLSPELRVMATFVAGRAVHALIPAGGSAPGGPGPGGSAPGGPGPGG